MKYISYIKTALIATVGITALNSCVKSDDYSIPPIVCNDKFTATNHALSELAALGKAKPTQADIISTDYIVEAYVSSSDQSGNIYKVMFLQDKPQNPTAGIEIDIDGSNQYVNYPVGAKVRLNLKGLVVQSSNGYVKVGSFDPTSSNYPAGRINPSNIGNYLARVCGQDNKGVIVTMVPTEFESVSDALKNGGNVNQLIKINNVQFEDAELTKTFADASGTGDRYITDKNGGRLDLRFSNYASFSTVPISSAYKGSGSITFVMSKFNTTNQGFVVNLSDIVFNKDRFVVSGGGTGSGVTPPAANAVALFKGYNFETWADFLSSLDTNGLKAYATQALGKGLNGSNALSIVTTSGTTTGNDYVFTVTAGSGFPTTPKRITFYMNGTGDGGLSFNVYDATGKYIPFNGGDIKGDVQLSSAASNAYGGSVNTGGKWVLVALDLSTMTNVNTKAGSNIFAFKIAKSSTFNLLLDDFKIE